MSWISCQGRLKHLIKNEGISAVATERGNNVGFKHVLGSFDPENKSAVTRAGGAHR